ncbi:MAG: hypothetical protein RSF79_30235, partial [Janthinobacterium sp.]
MQAQQNQRQAASLTVAYSADDEFDQDSIVSLHDFKDLERKAEAPEPAALAAPATSMPELQAVLQAEPAAETDSKAPAAERQKMELKAIHEAIARVEAEA